MNELAPADDDQLIERLRAELASISSGRRRIAVEAFFMAALGVIPWVGGFSSASVGMANEERAEKQDQLRER